MKSQTLNVIGYAGHQEDARLLPLRCLGGLLIISSSVPFISQHEGGLYWGLSESQHEMAFE